jgi:hypothetical protein
VGDFGSPATNALLDEVNRAFRPTVIVAHAADDQGEAAVPPLLAQRRHVNGQPAAYVCRHFTCRQPVTEPNALAVALATG